MPEVPVEASGNSRPSTAGSDRPPSAGGEKITVDDLTKKVIQLTKVIVHLHTCCENIEARTLTRRTSGEDEVRRIGAVAAGLVEAQRLARGEALKYRHKILDDRREQQRSSEEESLEALRMLRQDLDTFQAMETKKQERLERERQQQVNATKYRAEQLRSELHQIEGRAQSDQQWASRKLASDLAKRRQGLERAGEAELDELRERHQREMQEACAKGQQALIQLRDNQNEARTAAEEQAERDLQAAVEKQQASLEGDRSQFQQQLEAAREALATAATEAAEAKKACETRQKQLEEMSRELQDKRTKSRRHAQETDNAHDRKLKAEAELRSLKREKAALEKSLAARGHTDPFESPQEPDQAERAVAKMVEDVRIAQLELASSKHELERAARLAEDRRGQIKVSEQRSEVLQALLREERSRGEAIQRALVRLRDAG